MKPEILTADAELLKKIAKVAQDHNTLCYVIGGFVRDQLLNRPSKDIDIVTVGDGIIFAEAVAKYLNRTEHLVTYGRYGTAMLKLDGHEIEFVGARKESYTTDSRNPHVLPGTIEEDQLRRDFTINAMAISLNAHDYGELIDPFNGVDDLSNQIIRTPTDPDTTFSDDPLRMIRAIRFATQLGFSIEESTFNSIKSKAHRIDIISKERILVELNKILMSMEPSVGFHLLMNSKLLHLILPEVYDLKGAEYIDGVGHKDNFYHTLEVVDNVRRKSSNLWLLWAALLHDIGKPPTKKFHKELGWTFHGHENVGAKMVYKLFTRMKMPLDHKLKYVQKLVALHLRPISLTKENISDAAIRRLLFDAGEEIDDLMVLCSADITSKNASKKAKYLANYEIVKQLMDQVEEKDRLRNWQPPITGEIIMSSFNIKPCKEVGIIKTSIREAILDGIIENEYSNAFNFMIIEGKKLGLTAIENPSHKTTDTK